MMYYSLEPPTKWQAGISAPGTPNEQTFYFDCADCGAKEPDIAGILSSDGTFSGMGILKVEGSAFFNPAMFCAPCFAKRLEVAA
jgi:hypothetical protein